MKKRILSICAALFLLTLAAIVNLAGISGRAEYAAAAEEQSLYKLEVASSRGMIYDKSMTSLLGGERKWIAAVVPTIEAISLLNSATNGECRERLGQALKDGKPFILELPQGTDRSELKESDCIELFAVTERYSDDQLAAHLLGYVSGDGEGISGIELAMDDVLSQSGGKCEIYYRVDASGRALAGAETEVVNTLESSRAGVQLTIDRKIQKIAESAGKKLKSGAVVITEVPNCEIRALASFPTFSPNSLSSASEDGAFVNRAFSAFTPGSVFKLIGACSVLESGSPLQSFNCTGKITVDGLEFQCINGISHGKTDLCRALVNSCNCYFINTLSGLSGQDVLNTAYNLGLGAAEEFGRGLFTDSGILPEALALENKRAMANFSFGQGELTVTPLQMCAVLNAIASSGVYSTPRLIEATVDDELNATPVKAVTEKQERVLSVSNAKLIQSAMEQTAQSGTAASGAPENAACGIKTGTAQTGIYDGDEELLNFWYCGYIYADGEPKYCITVLSDMTADDDGATAEVFKEIAEALAEI